MSLIQAIHKGDLARVRELLAAGADPSAAEDGETPLITAIDKKKFKIVAALLEAGADVNGVDGQGYTPLIGAVGWKRSGLVRTLIERGANNFEAIPTAFPPFTALIWACSHGDFESARLLLEAGADPNTENQHGQNALIMSVDKPEIVSLLIQHGADPNKPTNDGGYPLIVAAYKPTGKGIRPLLAAGADPNVADKHGTTPLLAAIQQKLKRPVVWLLEAGADPNVAFQEATVFHPNLGKGVTPLMFAAEAGLTEIAAALLKAGARWDARDERGRTALDLALAGGHAEIAALLEEAAGPSQPKRRTAEQYSAMLLQAVKRGKLRQVQEALKGGGDPNVADTGMDFGKTPLMHACERNRPEIVEALLAAGADVNQKGSDNTWVGTGGCALFFAVEPKRADCLRLLLQAGAELEVFDNRGYTPLMEAADYGRTEAVRLLLEFGANPLTRRKAEEAEDEDAGDSHVDGLRDDFEFTDYRTGEPEIEPDTALGFAARAGDLEIMEMLLDAADEPVPGALLQAVANLQPEAVRLLLGRGYPASETRGDGRGPLHVLGSFAAIITLPKSKIPLCDRPESEWIDEANRRQAAVARLLLDAGAAVDQADSKGRTPLMTAASARTSLTMMVERSEDDSEYTEAKTDPGEFVRLLLAAGADPHGCDARGNTALHHLCRRDGCWDAPASETAAQALIQAGADVDAQNALGQTPLMIAAKGGDGAAVKSLLRFGADLNLRDRRGRAVMHYAVQFQPIVRRDLKKHLSMLVEAGADPDAADADGRTPLDYARDDYHTDAAKILKKLGARKSARVEAKLAKAAKKNDVEAVRALLDAGADMHREIRGENAFVRAVFAQSLAVVEELLERGADVNQPHQGFPFGTGSRALHFAAELDDPALLDLLLRRGADPQAANALKFTPVTLAAVYRKPENVGRLLEAGGRLDPIAEDFLELLSYDQGTKQPNYQAAVQEVTAHLGVEPQPLPWRDGLVCWPVDSQEEAKQKLKDDPKLNEWAAGYQAAREKLERLVSTLQPRLKEQGVLLLGVQSGRGCSPSSDYLALFPTTNLFALVAAMGVYGNDAQISCPELVGLLRELYELEPFDLYAMKNDALDIVFHRRVRDPEAIARRLYKMCPDIIEQGFEKMSRLVDSLKTGNQVHFWWD